MSKSTSYQRLKKAAVLCIGVLLFPWHTPAFAMSPEEIAQKWKERGNMAVARLQSLQQKLNAQYKKLVESALKDDRPIIWNEETRDFVNSSAFFLCEFKLEYAFARHAISDTEVAGIFHKVDNGIDFYKVVLEKDKSSKPVVGGDEAGLFVINYTYDHKTGEFHGTKVESLPKGWYIHAYDRMPNTLILDVNDDNVVIVFDITDPMNSMCIAAGTQPGEH